MMSRQLGQGAAATSNSQSNEVEVQEWDDGSRYEGALLDGLKHGTGKYTWASGEVIYMMQSGDGFQFNRKLPGFKNKYFHGPYRFNLAVSIQMTIFSLERDPVATRRLFLQGLQARKRHVQLAHRP